MNKFIKEINNTMALDVDASTCIAAIILMTEFGHRACEGTVID